MSSVCCRVCDVECEMSMSNLWWGGGGGGGGGGEGRGQVSLKKF